MSSPVPSAREGLNGWPIWCGAAMAFYVAGFGHVAQRENSRRPVPFWPPLLLAAPVFLAMLLNTGEARKSAMLVSLILVLWVARSVRTMFQPGNVGVARIVSGLLAGIVFVDWLAVAPQMQHPLSAVVFLACLARSNCSSALCR